MSDLISKAKLSALAWWLVVLYIVLFTLGSISTCAIAALVNVKSPSEMTWLQWALVVLSILANWTATMMAFVNQAFSRIKQYNDSNGHPSPVEAGEIKKSNNEN